MTKSSQSDDKVGHGNPPVGTRFPKGRSGNPNGRPKGHLNVANVTRKVLNRPVRVREGGKSRMMPAAEVLLRSHVNKALQGDGRSFDTIAELLEKTGLTNELSDEERKNREMRLPLSLEEPDWELLNAPALERERQRLSALADLQELPQRKRDIGPSVCPPIEDGDRLTQQAKFDEACDAYNRQIDLCKKDLDGEPENQQAQETFRTAVSRIGLLADRFLLAGDIVKAHRYAEAALVEAKSSFWVDVKDSLGNQVTNYTWIEMIRAHAAMFLGRTDEARSFYLGFSSNKRLAWTTWETVILQDFVRLRKAGHEHLLMTEIEKNLGEKGWTTQRGNTKLGVRKVNMPIADIVFIDDHPHDLKSGDLLRDHGDPDKAMEVYLRNLKAGKTKLDKDASNVKWQHELKVVVDRIALVTRKLLVGGRFPSAFEHARDALTVLPHDLLLEAVDAYALMYLNHEVEARNLLLSNRGKEVDGVPWETIILQDFAEQRKAGCSRPLMDEIEAMFSDGEHKLQSAGTSAHPDSETAKLLQSSDIQAGDALAERGMCDEALAVYYRRLELSQAAIDRFDPEPFRPQIVADRTAAAEKITSLAAGHIMNGQFEEALHAVECVLTVLPRAIGPSVYRAIALMLLGQHDEARELFRSLRGQRIDAEHFAEDLIRHEFNTLRDAGLGRPLMEEVERCFAETT